MAFDQSKCMQGTIYIINKHETSLKKKQNNQYQLLQYLVLNQHW